MDELLDIAYGNHPKSQKLKPKARKIIEALRDKEERTVYDLAGILSLDLTIPSNKKRFYTLIRPLKDKGMIQNRREKGKTYYYLSYDSFRYFLDHLRKTGEYWLKAP